MVMAIAGGLIGLWLFPQSGRVNLAWLCYLCSVAFYVASLFALFREREKGPNPILLDWKVAVSASLILLVAVLMRVYLFSAVPFGTWFDEADIGQGAVRIIKGTGDLPVYNIGAQSQPLHFTYLVSLSFRSFGVSTVSLRLVPAAVGILTVGAAFLLGIEIFGPRFGLILAFFFAVGRWHVTFSRLGFVTIFTPFFILLTLYFLFCAMRTKQPLHFGLSGLALGLGLDFQIAFRVMPIAVLLFFVYWMIRLWRDRSNFAPPGIVWVVNLAVFLLGVGLSVAPVAQYALREPEGFWNRTSQVSIFQRRDEPNLGRAVASNAVDHLLMFNYRGDRNGRHNLPGEPMLDPISGVLFVLGLGLAVRRLKQPAEFIFLIIFLLGLSGGIFSVDFESPQAQRAIGALPAVYFFAALSAESVWIGVQRLGNTRIRRFFLTLSFLVAAAAVLYLNAHTYFARQANDPVAWASHNAAETMTAAKLRELDADQTTVYLSMFLNNHLVIRFLAPEFVSTQTILPPEVVPLREPGDKSVVLFVDRDQDWVVGDVLQLYPGAEHSAVLDPIGDPVLHKVLVPAEVIQAIQGLTVRYWAGSVSAGEPTAQLTEKTLEVDWPAGSPIAPPFLAEWEGILSIPGFAAYQLRLEAPSEASVWVDEQLVLQKRAGEEQAISLQLSQGNHTLRVQAAGQDGLVRLAWRSNPEDEFETIPARYLYLSPPVNSSGLVGSYFEGADWNARPAFARIDPFIDMYIHLIPLPRPYGVEWRGQIEIPTAGEYEFGVRVNGQAQLFINDELVVDASEPTEYQGAKIRLDEGRNRLRLRFLDNVGASRIHLYWTRPGEIQSTVIPSDVLIPRE